MKYLKDETFNDLKSKADNFDKLAEKIIAANQDLKAEDITVEMLLEQLEQAADNSDAKEELTSANQTIEAQKQTIAEKDQEISTLQIEVTELKKTGDGNPSGIDKDDELNSKDETPEEYCANHSFAQNVAYLKKKGIINN